MMKGSICFLGSFLLLVVSTGGQAPQSLAQADATQQEQQLHQQQQQEQLLLAQQQLLQQQLTQQQKQQHQQQEDDQKSAFRLLQKQQADQQQRIQANFESKLVRLEAELMSEKQLEALEVQQQQQTRESVNELKEAVREATAGGLMRREVNAHTEFAATKGEPCSSKSSDADAEEQTVQWHYCKLPTAYTAHESTTYIDCVGSVCANVEPEFIQKVINASMTDCKELVAHYGDCLLDIHNLSASLPRRTLLGHLCNTECPDVCRSSLLQVQAKIPKGELPPLPSGEVTTPPPTPEQRDIRTVADNVARSLGYDTHQSKVSQDSSGTSAGPSAGSAYSTPADVGGVSSRTRTSPTGRQDPSPVMGPMVDSDSNSQQEPIYPIDRLRESQQQAQDPRAQEKQQEVYSVELPPLPGELQVEPAPVRVPPLPQNLPSQPAIQPLL